VVHDHGGVRLDREAAVDNELKRLLEYKL